MLWVAQRGMTERAKELLDMNPDLVRCQDEDGYSPLHRASYSNRPHMVEVRTLCMFSGSCSCQNLCQFIVAISLFF